MELRYFAAAALVAAAAMGATAQANLITNGSFENSSGATIDNWVIVAGPTSRSQADYSGSTGTSPYGSRFLTLNPGLSLPAGSATQDFGGTTLGQLYEVTFAYAQLGGAANDQTLTVTINNTSAPSVVNTYVFTDPTPGTDFGTVWNRATFQFVGLGVPTGITFADTGVVPLLSQTSDLLIDDVAINEVPEPASLSALALGAATILRRRR